jgi:hypothetical protein
MVDVVLSYRDEIEDYCCETEQMAVIVDDDDRMVLLRFVKVMEEMVLETKRTDHIIVWI